MSRVHAAFPPTAHPLPDHIQMTGEEFISFCLDLTNSNSQWGTIENIQSCSITRANEDPKLKKRRYCLNLLSTFIVLLLIILICFCCHLAVVTNYNLFGQEMSCLSPAVPSNITYAMALAQQATFTAMTQADVSHNLIRMTLLGFSIVSLLFFLWLMAHSNRSFRDDGLDFILLRVAFILLQGLLLYKVADSLYVTGLADNVLRAVLKSQPGFVTYCRSAYRYYFSATTLFPPLLAFVIFALIFLLAKLNNNRPQSSSSITNIETG